MLFSVIVPIYNVEKYLRRCIESILCQSYSNFELILVDDGSPDSCPEICDEYMEKDERIKVIHKPNGGLVSARQAGIRAACGEYVVNVDSDDAVEKNYLQNSYQIITETNADMISYSYVRYVDNKPEETVHDYADEGLYDSNSVMKNIFPKILCDENMEHMFYFLSGKTIRRTILTKHQLLVSTKISQGEDICCVIPCFLESRNVYMSKKPLYFYTVRKDSLSSSFKIEHFSQIEETIKRLKELDVCDAENFDNQLSRYSCFMCFATIACAAEEGRFEYINKISTAIKNSIHNEMIPKAKFEKISSKSRIAVTLLKKRLYRTTFIFLWLSKLIKCIIRKG